MFVHADVQSFTSRSASSCSLFLIVPTASPRMCQKEAQPGSWLVDGQISPHVKGEYFRVLAVRCPVFMPDGRSIGNGPNDCGIEDGPGGLPRSGRHFL